MNRPGICKLCKQQGELQNSHLLPSACYALIHSRKTANPNPVFVTDRRAYTTSRQIQDYLLCSDCEDRFNKRGEAWVLENCYRGPGRFLLRENLTRYRAVAQHVGILVFEGARIPEIDCAKLIFFGMSVFWRAGAHDWPRGNERAGIALGSYLDPIGHFLLDETNFPDKMLLVVRVSSLQDGLLGHMNLPESQTNDGFRTHHFAIPGVIFMLSVGGKIPPDQMATAPNPECYISICPQFDRETLEHTSMRVNSAKRRGHL